MQSVLYMTIFQILRTPLIDDRDPICILFAMTSFLTNGRLSQDIRVHFLM